MRKLGIFSAVFAITLCLLLGISEIQAQGNDAGNWELANGYHLKAVTTKHQSKTELELFILKDIEGQPAMIVAIEITESGKYAKSDVGEDPYHFIYHFEITRTIGKATYCDIYIPKLVDQTNVIFSCG